MLRIQITPDALASIERLAKLSGESPDLIASKHLRLAVDKLIKSDIQGEALSEPPAGIMSRDRKALACNLTESISEASKGALAYVIDPGRGSGSERVCLYLRSRSGRWIQKWEARSRLNNFRFKTIPPEHPKYSNKDFKSCLDQAEYLLQYQPEILSELNRC